MIRIKGQDSLWFQVPILKRIKVEIRYINKIVRLLLVGNTADQFETFCIAEKGSQFDSALDGNVVMDLTLDLPGLSGKG